MLYWIIGRENGLLACTSAIICMQSSVGLSVLHGTNRLAGTAVGAFLGMVFLYLHLLIPVVDLTILFAALGVMMLIALCNRIRLQDSIVIASVVLLVIILGDHGGNPFLYSLNRLIDTTVGIVIAVIINRFVYNPAAYAAGSQESPECFDADLADDGPADCDNNQK